ncbi:MAG TPA: hypothetical protein DIS78_03135 [Lachnospiraceae bacterium]|nr:hypothetical protein [Lachnospiraceae bacterium]
MTLRELFKNSVIVTEFHMDDGKTIYLHRIPLKRVTAMTGNVFVKDIFNHDLVVNIAKLKTANEKIGLFMGDENKLLLFDEDTFDVLSEEMIDHEIYVNSEIDNNSCRIRVGNYLLISSNVSMKQEVFSKTLPLNRKILQAQKKPTEAQKSKP